MKKLINIKYDLSELGQLDDGMFEILNNLIPDMKSTLSNFGYEFIFTPFTFEMMEKDDVVSNIDAMISYLKEYGKTEWLKEIAYRILFGDVTESNLDVSQADTDNHPEIYNECAEEDLDGTRDI